jgi:hypothetical protein
MVRREPASCMLWQRMHTSNIIADAVGPRLHCIFNAEGGVLTHYIVHHLNYMSGISLSRLARNYIDRIHILTILWDVCNAPYISQLVYFCLSRDLDDAKDIHLPHMMYCSSVKLRHAWFEFITTHTPWYIRNFKLFTFLNPISMNLKCSLKAIRVFKTY